MENSKPLEFNISNMAPAAIYCKTLQQKQIVDVMHTMVVFSTVYIFRVFLF